MGDAARARYEGAFAAERMARELEAQLERLAAEARR
jgi:hypothetical protein